MIQHTTLTSDKNPLLRDIRRAIAKGTPTHDGYCVAETFHLLEEAIRSKRPIKAVIASESMAPTVQTKGHRITVVSDALFRTLVSTETAQGVLALVEVPKWSIDDVLKGEALVVALDGVQDPGNAGTVIRTAEAFGASGVLFLKGSVSPFNPKTLRASAGSLFRLPFVYGVDHAEAQAAIGHLEIFTAAPQGRTSLSAADLTRPCALIVGSEAHGVGDQWKSRATSIRIPTAGVESLNASVAAGIILYEASRQRSLSS